MQDEQLLINSMTPPRKRFVLVPWFVFGSLIVCTNAFILQCPPCEYVTCPPLECTNSTLHTYFDECGCCILCGKAEGERCGGESNAGGNCVSGLSCNYRTGIVLGDERMGQCEPGEGNLGGWYLIKKKKKEKVSVIASLQFNHRDTVVSARRFFIGKCSRDFFFFFKCQNADVYLDRLWVHQIANEWFFIISQYSIWDRATCY